MLAQPWQLQGKAKVMHVPMHGLGHVSWSHTTDTTPACVNVCGINREDHMGGAHPTAWQGLLENDYQQRAVWGSGNGSESWTLPRCATQRDGQVAGDCIDADCIGVAEDRGLWARRVTRPRPGGAWQ